MLVILKLVAAVVLGVLCGGVVNSGIVIIGPKLIPPPPGVDMTTVAGITAALPQLEAKHFAAPFLAHAMGTLVGAAVAGLLTVSHRPVVSYSVGALFLAGGIAASRMIPAPTTFVALDLLVAYLPMAWLGLFIADRLKPRAG